MLGEFTGEEEADGSLDLSGRQGVLLVVSNELGGLEGNLLEDVVDERVHDLHGSLGDASLGVNLLEDSVDVDGEGLSASASSGSGSLGDLSGLLGDFSSGGTLSGSSGLLGSHVVESELVSNLNNYKWRALKYYRKVDNPKLFKI